jgi:FixJ family two-component response regulator
MSDTPLIRIVDDDPELLASQKMLLETLGWEVITYASGVEFLKHDELKRVRGARYADAGNDGA